MCLYLCRAVCDCRCGVAKTLEVKGQLTRAIVVLVGGAIRQAGRCFVHTSGREIGQRDEIVHNVEHVVDDERAALGRVDEREEHVETRARREVLEQVDAAAVLFRRGGLGFRQQTGCVLLVDLSEVGEGEAEEREILGPFAPQCEYLHQIAHARLTLDGHAVGLRPHERVHDEQVLELREVDVLERVEELTEAQRGLLTHQAQQVQVVLVHSTLACGLAVFVVVVSEGGVVYDVCVLVDEAEHAEYAVCKGVELTRQLFHDNVERLEYAEQLADRYDATHVVRVRCA